MANFTDFDALAMEPAVSLAYLERPGEMAAADMLILPGTKQTLDDLQWLEHRGFAGELRRLSEIGTPIIGICGGFQMLGISIEDPQGIENQGTPCNRVGLGFLPVRTMLHPEKTVRRIHGQMRRNVLGAASCIETVFHGYEIHLGETAYEMPGQPFADIFAEGISGSVGDGAVSSCGRVIGTYVHGLFDDDEFRHGFVAAARTAAGLARAAVWANVAAERETRIDRWADHLRKSLNMHVIKSWIVDPPRRARREKIL
jgi:adenosylcobyric acid synthase